MHKVRIGFIVTLLVILGLGFGVSAGSAASQENQDQATRLQQKIERLQALAQQRQKEGVDMQPIGEIAQGIKPLLDQQKFSEAEALVDRVLKMLGEPSTPAATA